MNAKKTDSPSDWLKMFEVVGISIMGLSIIGVMWLVAWATQGMVDASKVSEIEANLKLWEALDDIPPSWDDPDHPAYLGPEKPKITSTPIEADLISTRPISWSKEGCYCASCVEANRRNLERKYTKSTQIHRSSLGDTSGDVFTDYAYKATGGRIGTSSYRW